MRLARIEQHDFDVADAMRRLGGREALYRRLMAEFVVTFGPGLGELPRLLADAKVEEARRGMHTLEGISANLSAGRVRRAAMELRLAVKAGETALDPLLHALEQALASAVQSARKLAQPEE